MNTCVTVPRGTTDHRLGTGCLKVKEMYQQLETTAFISDGINSIQAKDQCLEYADRLIYLQFQQETGNFFQKL